MKSRQINGELVITETPGCLWIFGLFFVFVGGIFVYGSLGGFSDYGSIAVWQLALACAMGAIAVGVGIWIIYRAPANKIIINSYDKTVVLQRLGLRGKTRIIYNFEEINRFCIIEEQDDESNLIWSLGMERTDGETIKISSFASHNESFKRDFVFQINEFMHKQMPSAQVVFELEDESNGEIS